MTYKQMVNKLRENRSRLAATNDLNEKRRLINENHNLMKAMDACWTKTQGKPIWGGR